jgi:hypothetical protein
MSRTEGPTLREPRLAAAACPLRRRSGASSSDDPWLFAEWRSGIVYFG